MLKAKSISSNKNSIRRVLACALFLIAVIGGGCSSQDVFQNELVSNITGASSAKADGTFQECSLVRVVDGDTLVVNVDGTEQKVRLIGIDTPESVSSNKSKNCDEGKTASEYTKSLVQSGQTLYLQQDVSDTDKYGRLLRYVWLEEPQDANNIDEVSSKMLNGVIVANGYAQAKQYKPDTAYSNVFSQLQESAAAQGLGVSDYFAK